MYCAREKKKKKTQQINKTIRYDHRSIGII